MEVSLEKEAFVVGEVVSVKVNISNLSNTSIEALRVKIGTVCSFFFHSLGDVISMSVFCLILFLRKLILFSIVHHMLLC